jgi:flagellar basal body-associated protein FliL
MAKKAKLDILDITPDEPGGEMQPEEATAEKGRDDGSSGEQTGGDFSSKVIGWVRKPLFRIILIAVAFLGLTAGILVSYYQSMDRDAPAMQKTQAVSVTPFPEVKPVVLFEGMVVDQKDEKGNIRIVFCDIALELLNHKPAGAIDGDRVDVRIVIYDVLKKEPAREGLSQEGRGRLKEKLKNELNSLFGEDLVKSVYFTRYEVD